MYLLDSSAIAILLKRFKGEALRYIAGMHTLDLARYELGNVIWKECILRSLISHEDSLSKARHVVKVLNTMKLDSINSEEGYSEAMKLAIKLKLTFYDASYLYEAKRQGLILVTEDKELREKSNKARVNAINVKKYVEEYSSKSYP